MKTLNALNRAGLLLGSCTVLLGGCPAVEDVPENVRDQALRVCDEGAYEGRSAVLRDVTGKSIGLVTFSSVEGATLVTVAAELPHEQAGIHGFHIHANDDPKNGEDCIADPDEPASTHFVSADGHYNPDKASHGHHSGDMPALFFTHSGYATMRFLTDSFDAEDLVGKAVILHAGADNYGNVPVGENPDQYSPNSEEATALTARTGNAGARIACGIIE